MKEEGMSRDNAAIARWTIIVLALAMLLPMLYPDPVMGRETTNGISGAPEPPGININISNFKELVRGSATDGVWSVSWSPDETRIISGQRDNRAVIWDTSNMTILKVLPGHTGQVTSVAWSPAGAGDCQKEREMNL